MYSAPTPPEGLVAEVVAIENAAKPESFNGKDVRGKIVLTDGIGIEIGLNAFERGAVGVISDAMRLSGSPHEKTPGHFDNAAQWHNYTIPPWKTARKGFGFSLTPANGRRLREMLKANASVRLRAVVKTRLYAGVLPLVTGLLPGETDEEIVITGHMDEPGANDNNSGCALGLEVVRTLKALAECGKLPKLRRGIRLAFSFEVRGYQAFLANWPHLSRLVAGINLDMLGNDLSDARSRATLLYNWAALPAATDALGLDLMRRLARDDPLFRFRAEEGALVDNLFGDPAVGAPMCVLGCWPDAYYHTSLDTIEHISPRAMAHMGRVAATYCAFLATAGLPEAAWLAHLTLAFGKEQVLEATRRGDAPEQIKHVVGKNVERLRSVTRLASQREEIVQRAEELGRRLAAFARREMKQLREQQRYAAPIANRNSIESFDSVESRNNPRRPTDSRSSKERAKRLVPIRTFRGSPCFEALDDAALAELKAKTGLGVGWGAPHWLHLALFRADGKRTALDIWRWLRLEGQAVGLAVLNNTIEFMARHGLVKLASPEAMR